MKITEEAVDRALEAAHGTMVDTRHHWTQDDKQAVRAMLDAGIGTCLWSREEDGSDTWSTGCGKEFQINDAQSTNDAGMKFCCFCGGQFPVVSSETVKA